MRKTRAAFISAGGDPFLILMMLHLFETRWSQEVDRLYICFNGTQDAKIVQYVSNKVSKNPKIVFIYDGRNLGFGEPISMCLSKCTEELILLLEDDGFIYNSGVVDACFRQIEEHGYDIVGSPRFSCSFEWSALMKKKLGLTYKKQGDTGPNFWPNFFFCRKSDLLKTDCKFAPISFPKGTYVPILDYTAQEEGLVGDTFVWVSVQLRMMGLKVFEVPQRKASPTESEDMMRGDVNWASPQLYGWIHGGSLSVMVSGPMRGNQLPETPNDLCLMEYETRVSFWKMAVNLFPYEEIGDYKRLYIGELEKTIDHHKMDRERINKKLLIYRQMMHLW